MKQRVAIIAFKTLKNLKSKYHIDTRRGKIFNKKTKKEVGKNLDAKGYCVLHVIKKNKDGSKKITHSVQRSHLIFWAKHKKLPNIEICIDHIDGNKTNDKASNLQPLTRQENVAKRKKQNNFYGVSKTGDDVSYRARLRKNGVQFEKRFKSETDAATARDLMVVNAYLNEYKQKGFMPPLNFPDHLPVYLEEAKKQKPKMVQMELCFA